MIDPLPFSARDLWPRMSLDEKARLCARWLLGENGCVPTGPQVVKKLHEWDDRDKMDRRNAWKVVDELRRVVKIERGR